VKTDLATSVRNKPPVVAFFTCSNGDWGGASRVLFTNLWQIDVQRLTPLVILPGRGPIEDELCRRGFQYEVFSPFTEPGDPIKYLRALWRTMFFLKREKVAAIHVNRFNFWRPAELLAAHLLRIPIITHYHLVIDEPSPAIQWCRAAFCVSRYTTEHSHPKSLTKPVIYNSVDLERFDAGHSMRDQLGISADEVVVAFLGQIRDIKGIADFIAMARRIDDPHARFLIAGECRDPMRYPGSYSEQDLKDMAGGDTRIHYIGYVKEVENVYHTADIIVVPSRWQEPLGLINLEASACRKPVVATRVGGIPEVVEDGVNGYLVEPGNVTHMAQRVSQLIADPALRQRLGEAGRARVEAEFTTRPVRVFENLLLDYARC
jgi:glycosyltransferase involved in cell wall biosynthesis